MIRISQLLCVFCSFSLLGGSLAAEDDFGAARGVTVSCFRNGPGEWDSPQMLRTMRELRSLGANAVAFHPYARIGNDGSLRFRGMDRDPSVLFPLREGREMKLGMLLKPHLAYWGSRFTWRGEITFQSEANWRRFFADYERWIVHQAKLAEKGEAAMFCVGTELCGTVHREAEWRRIIAAVREVYSGPLTYAANWDRYQRVPFWDALDVIGIQAYFPLAKDAPATAAEIHAGWDRVMAELRGFSQNLGGKRILFTELGYNRSAKAALEPWAYEQGGPQATTMKLRCTRIALERVRQEPVIIGSFLWKWFPTEREFNYDFVLQYPAMKRVIEQVWQEPAVTARPSGPADSG